MIASGAYNECLKPDYWQDEELFDPEFTPQSTFTRSINQYHVEQQPWLDADLVLERIEGDSEGKDDD